MGDRAESAQVQVPPVIVLVEPGLGDSPRESVEVLFALAPADDLSQTRHKNVHPANRPIVVVHFHVERLDLLRIVGDDHRPSVDRFGEVLLVLTLEVDAPADRELEAGRGTGQRVYCLGIGDASEGAVGNRGQAVDQAVLDTQVEELHVLPAFGQEGPDQCLEKLLGQIHVALNVAECDLRLDHPELRQVPAGVGVLGAEGRPERVHV